MAETANGLDPILKQKKRILNVIAIARCLARNYTQTDIARIYKVSKQAVNEYIHNHADELEVLLDSTDNILAQKTKLIAHKAMGNLNTILDFPPEKKDMFALNAVSGTHIDKYRDLSGKSAIEIAINVADISIFVRRKVEGNPEKTPEIEAEIVNIPP